MVSKAKMVFFMGDYMKKMFLAFTLFISAIVIAADTPSDTFMSIAEQETLISNIAQQMRHAHWSRGYDDVTSSETYVSRVWLDNYLSQPNMFADFFDENEVEEIEWCYAKESCELYYISVASSYMGGYGVEGSFIFLHTKSGKYFSVSHTVYAE